MKGMKKKGPDLLQADFRNGVGKRLWRLQEDLIEFAGYLKKGAYPWESIAR
jgi:hypothetical protein